MRRGLLHWDPQELPLAVLEARIARLRAAMQTAGLDAFILYTNIVRPSAVAWLTGFTPYWSESLLLVPRDGRLVFATAMTNRVADWIRSTNPVSDVTSTPKPGALIGEALARNTRNGRVGVLELDGLPSELSDHLSAAAPQIEWIDGTALFGRLRDTIDDAERGLIARADRLASDALAQVDPGNVADAGTLAGTIERHARLAGAEEVYIAVAPDLDADRRLMRVSKPVPLGHRFAVRASVAYKGNWVRRMRTFAKDEASVKAEDWFANAIRTLAADRPLGAQLAASAATLPEATLSNWMAESSVAAYPLQVVASARTRDATFANGQFVVLTVELSLRGMAWIGAGPGIVGAARFGTGSD
jgi:hypothetical protein